MSLPLNDAKEMVKAYQCHPKKLKLVNGQTLQSVVISKEKIQALLEAGGGINDVDHFEAIFAVNHEQRNSGDPAQQSFTIILAAVKDGEYVEQDMQNLFIPCPSCDNNYQQVFIENNVPGECLDQ